MVALDCMVNIFLSTFSSFFLIAQNKTIIVCVCVCRYWADICQWWFVLERLVGKGEKRKQNRKPVTGSRRKWFIFIRRIHFRETKCGFIRKQVGKCPTHLMKEKEIQKGRRHRQLAVIMTDLYCIEAHYLSSLSI